MRVHYLQHVPFEEPGSIMEFLIKKGAEVSSTRLFDDEILPSVNSFDVLIVMGGPMSIYDDDTFCWLKRERDFIKETIASDKKVLGICLGAQFIADALGAKVYSNKKREIGWFSVFKSKELEKSSFNNNFPKKFTPFHWHGDTFDIPSKAISIGDSSCTANQGFIYNEKVIALQFHLEIDAEGVRNLIENCKDEILESEFIQKEKEMLNYKNLYIANLLMKNLLNTFLS